MLIFRLQPIVGESWPGYLLRLAQKNNFSGIAGLAKMLGMKQLKLMLASPDAVLGLLKIEVPQNVPENFVPNNHKKQKLSMHGRSMRSRVCPRCIESSVQAYIPANWDQAFGLNCEQHQILLIDRCLNCKQPITYLRQSLHRCDCGYKFEKGPSEHLKFSLDNFLNACSLQDQYAKSASTFGKNSQLDVDAFLLCRGMLRVSGSHLADENKKSRYDESFATAESMQEIIGWFEDWPNKFNEFLSSTFPISKIFQKKALFGQVDRKGVTLPLVRSVVANYLKLRKSDRMKLCMRRYKGGTHPRVKSMAVLKSSSSAFVGIRYVMEATGCTYSVAKFWIERGWLGKVTTIDISPKKIQYKISKVAAQKAIQICKSTSKLREMSAEIGLASETLRYLVHAGKLTSIPYGRGAMNFRLIPAEVFDLGRRLLNESIQVKNNDSNMIRFSEAINLVGRQMPHLLKPFLDAILACKIKLKTLEDYTVDLGHVFVLKKEFKDWRSEAKCQYADA